MIKTHTKNCQRCSKEYTKSSTRSVKHWKGSKYCSHACFRLERGGWNTGKKFSKETRNKMSRSRILNPPTYKFGEEHHNWKGDGVGYYALHVWLKRCFGSPKRCEFCNKKGEYNIRRTENKDIKVWNIQWANKDGNYKRVRDNWLQLCISCHKLYDLKKYYV